MEMDAMSPDNSVKKTETDAVAVRPDTAFGLAVVAAGIAVLFAMFWDTAASFIPIWNTDSFGHGYLIVPISLFLMWLCRFRALEAQVRPSIIGAVLLFGMSLIWGLGELADVNIVRQFAFVGMIQLLFLTVTGWAVVRTLIFPLGYLVFAVPFGEFLIPYLQDITAWFAVGALQAVGIPTFNDGIYIQTPAGNYLVAEACSGVRYLLSTLAVSVLAAGLFFQTWKKRLLFLAVGIVVPVAANAVRAAGVVALAYWIDPELAGPVHITYGLIFVAIITLIYLFVGASFKERTVGEYVDMKLPSVARTATRRLRLSVIVVGVAAILCVAASSNYVRFTMAQAGPLSAGMPDAPSVRPPWQPQANAGDDWQPRFKGVSTEVLQGYRSGDQEAELYIGYYVSQRPGAELVSRTNTIENDAWGRAGGGTLELAIDGSDVTANVVRLLPQRHTGNSSALSGRVVWYWYWVGDEFTGNVFYAKFLEMKATLIGQSRAAAVIAITAGYEDQPAEAFETLRGFVDHLGEIEPGLLKAGNN